MNWSTADESCLSVDTGGSVAGRRLVAQGRMASVGDFVGGAVALYCSRCYRGAVSISAPAIAGLLAAQTGNSVPRNRIVIPAAIIA